MDAQARSPRPTNASGTRGNIPHQDLQHEQQQGQQQYRDERPSSPSGVPKYGGPVQTSADAYRQKKMENRVCGGAPYRGYSSYLSYIVQLGWIYAPDESGPQAAMRIRRSMSSRITFDSKNPAPEDM